MKLFLKNTIYLQKEGQNNDIEKEKKNILQ